MIEIIWQEFTNGSFPISNRFKAIVHQTKWLFKYPDVAVKQEVNVKVENDVVPEVEEQTCSAPGTSHQSTPVKRNGTASFPAKSPKKQKIEIDSTDGSKNNNGPENDSTNGEGFRTPVTRSKRTFENLQFLFCLQISINFFFFVFHFIAGQSKEISPLLFGFSFYCGNCDGEPFESPDKVYEHWKHTHVGDRTDPFTFRVSNLTSCHYCGYPGAYSALRTHNCPERGTKPMVFVDVRDETQCAMCAFKGDNIVAHAMAEHAVVNELKIHNPIAINESSLKELLDFSLYKKVSFT